ncbi:MAG: helicase-associated domain-containing protein [Planctomycetota bacterium]
MPTPGGRGGRGRASSELPERAELRARTPRSPVAPRISAGGGGASAPTVSAALKLLRKPELAAPYRFWAGEGDSAVPGKVADIRAALMRWMKDAHRVAERVAKLPAPERIVLRAFAETPTLVRRREDIEAVSNGETRQRVDALKRAGLLFDIDDAGDAWAVPKDLPLDLAADALQSAEEPAPEEPTPTGGAFSILTLKGHLESQFAASSRRMPPARLRAQFKMYSNEAQAVARIERLPEGLRDLVGKIVLEFGGLLPRRFFERMETELPHWNQRRWAKILGESLVGTVDRLDFTPYGIQHDDDTFVVFNEVTLAWFKRVAVPSDPDAPHDARSLGVDLAANLTRFFAYLQENAVRFTAAGEIFKSTEKRILTELIPNPGVELERGDVLNFIFRFARQAGFIEVTGERTFKLGAKGRAFDELGLDDKLDALFQHVKGEVDVEAESIHQPALRSLLLTMMKRLEVGVWYDVMYLPFLARNAYLAQIETFAAGVVEAGAPGVPQDLQRLSWNLVNWVRKRLYLLGIVDLGYDSNGHPVAMRLTQIGARVLGMSTAEPGVSDGIGRLIVTPDFEVILFGDGDDADLVYDLDRFADRRSSDGALRQFRLDEKSVHRGLLEGVTLQRMVDVLTANARTPVPQNVLHTLRGWAAGAGLLMLGADHVVRSTDPGLIARFVRDAGVRPFVKAKIDEHSVQLKTRTSRARYRTLLRDLDYLVELDG